MAPTQSSVDEYFQEVSRVIYVDQPISDATLAPLDNLGGIEELCFLSRMGHHTLPEVMPPPGLERLTEAGLARLGKLTRLRRLDIEEYHPSEEGEHYLRGSMLNQLNRARGLEELRLFQAGMTDRGMPPLRSMPHLRKLDLWCNRLTGTFLAPIRGSATLQVLELRWNPISDAGLENIGTLTNLRELDLSDTDVDDAGVSHLTALTNLTELGLGRDESDRRRARPPRGDDPARRAGPGGMQDYRARPRRTAAAHRPEGVTARWNLGG